MNIAGVKVGEVGSVELEDGRAVVTMRIQDEYKDVYRNATILLRPKTGLKDMFLALDPGTQDAGKLRRGEPGEGRPARSPDINADEFLAQLDGDTRDYLRILLNAGGEAFRAGDSQSTGAGQTSAQDLRETLKRFEPLSRNGARITQQLAHAQGNLERVIHNFQLILTELARRTPAGRARGLRQRELRGACGGGGQPARGAAQLFPPALSQTETTLTKTSALAAELGPALERLRPFARELAPALRETRPFLRETTPIIRDQIRPFARDAQPTVRELRATART